MKLTVTKPTEVVATHIIVNVPIRYGIEDLPEEIDTGRICDWPAGSTADIDMKVCDEGNYTLAHIVANEPVIGFKATTLAEIREDYVPSCIPGDYGDYVRFTVNGDGVVAKWADYCTPATVAAAFFGKAG